MKESLLAELEGAPFGRRLHLLCHRLPRRCKLGEGWELERGFQLSVLSDCHFELLLGPGTSPGSSEERFLIWHSPGCYEPDRFTEFCDLLVQYPQANVGLILSHSSERTQSTLDFPKYRKIWSKVEQPVLQVFQDFPNSDYFSVEKNLFHLGRIGRRLVRLGKYRRLMPW